MDFIKNLLRLVLTTRFYAYEPTCFLSDTPFSPLDIDCDGNWPDSLSHMTARWLNFSRLIHRTAECGLGFQCDDYHCLADDAFCRVKINFVVGFLLLVLGLPALLVALQIVCCLLKTIIVHIIFPIIHKAEKKVMPINCPSDDNATKKRFPAVKKVKKPRFSGYPDCFEDDELIMLHDACPDEKLWRDGEICYIAVNTANSYDEYKQWRKNHKSPIPVEYENFFKCIFLVFIQKMKR